MIVLIVEIGMLFLFLSELFTAGFYHPALAIFLNEHKSHRSDHGHGQKSECELEAG